MAGIVIRKIRKSYGDTEVVHGVDLEVKDGEFVVLVGPSGCGKSTMLRMVAGLESIASGEIEIDGKYVNDLPPSERDIAMVFQSYALYPHKTVEANMSFALKVRGASKEEMDSRVQRAASILGLEPYLKRYPRHLSGGQRQRVAMGRAIVRDPTVFLFDEPLSNLDAKLRVQMRAEIKELQQRLGTTTIYVTHDQIEAMTMADRIVIMNAGNIEQIGKPLELYDRPQSTFVASFIGSPAMNMVHGSFATTNGKPGVSAQEHFLPLPQVSGIADGQQLVWGIRPEHILPDEQGIEAQITLVEPTGSELLLHCRVGDFAMLSLLRERKDFEPGQKIRLQPQLEHLHVFDEQSGQRIADLSPVSSNSGEQY